MNAPRVVVNVHCAGSELGVQTMVIPADKYRSEAVIVLTVGTDSDASIYITQEQAADISLALSRAISDVDRLKAAPLVEEVTR